MKTIFRKMRSEQSNKRNWFNYVLYAIGEIILLIIGVLMALQINNWNEERKLRKLEIVSMKNLIEEIDFNNKTLFAINRHDSINVSNNRELMQLLKNPDQNYDTTLQRYFTSMLSSRLFITRKVTFENLKANNFNVIASDSMRIKISFIYDALYHYLENDQRKNKAESKKSLHLLVIKNFEKNQDHKIIPNDFKALQNNQEFINTFSFHISFMEDILYQNKDFHSYFDSLLLELKQYLEEIEKK